jgi:hypothetical protein
MWRLPCDHARDTSFLLCADILPTTNACAGQLVDKLLTMKLSVVFAKDLVTVTKLEAEFTGAATDGPEAAEPRTVALLDNRYCAVQGAEFYSARMPNVNLL